MPGGRPPKTTEQKRRTGNPGKRKLPEAPKLGSTLPPMVSPDQLPDLGTLLSGTAGELLASVLSAGCHWIAPTDIKVLQLRDLLEIQEELRLAIHNPPDEATAAWRTASLDGYLSVVKVVNTALAECGFDPTARSRLGLNEVKAASKMEQLQAMRDKKRSKAKGG